MKVSVEGKFPAYAPHVFYFGCGREKGHYVFSHGNLSLGRCEVPPNCPWTLGHMDGGLLKNGRVPDVPDGRVYFTVAKNDWHAFFWWDRSVDQRGASNSGFYVQGYTFRQYRPAFEHACSIYPEVVARQRHPLLLQDRDFPAAAGA